MGKVKGRFTPQSSQVGGREWMKAGHLTVPGSHEVSGDYRMGRDFLNNLSFWIKLIH